MNAKQRDTVLQRWSGIIRRETRDLASLDQAGARALADSDVRDDPTLIALIRADIQLRRTQLDFELQPKEPAPVQATSRPMVPIAAQLPVPVVSQEKIHEAFNHLVLAVCAALERNDETEAETVFEQMCTHQLQSPLLISADTIADYQGRLGTLRTHLQSLRAEIEDLAQQAVTASRAGSEPDFSRATRRLTAIHAAHPPLLTETRLEQIRAEITEAADERRQQHVTTRKLLERQRAITAEIRKLAVAVRHFHEVACTTPVSGAAFRAAETQYLRTIQEVLTYNTEWFAGVVLELADLTAEWAVPPLGGEDQVDRFLDSINKGLRMIRGEMRDIEGTQQSNDRGSAAAD